MKSRFRENAPSHPLHKPNLDAVSSSTELTTEKTDLNELFARVGEGIVLVDEDGEIQRINPAFTRIFGYSEEEAVGQPLEALISLDDPLEEMEAQTSAEIANGDTVIPETLRRRNDGTRIPVSFVKV